MKRVLFFISILISLTCAMRNWQFNIGFRIFIYNIFEIVFILSFIIYSLGKKRNYSLSKSQRQLIDLLVIWLIIVIFSDIFALIFPLNEYSVDQSIKGILINILNITFLILFILFYNDIIQEKQEKIINYFILGVIISAVYSFFQFYSLKLLGFNLDSKIWPAVSYNYIFNEKNLKFDFIYRLMGVTGSPNTQALYILIILPILSNKFYINRTVKNFFILIILYSAFFLTLSRSSILALFFILFIIILHSLKNSKLFINIILFLIPISIFAYYYREDIRIILQSRQLFEDSNRLRIYNHAFELFLRYPLGVGYNNYSAYRLFFYGAFSQPNTHNSWLTILTENGIQGILFYIYYFYFLLKTTYKHPSQIAISYRYSLIAIIISVTFNNTLSLFFVNYFIILFFLNTSTRYETNTIIDLK